MPTIPRRSSATTSGTCFAAPKPARSSPITVAGRPVAQLGPAQRRRWVSGPDLLRVWATPAPETLADDLERFPAELADPFE